MSVKPIVNIFTTEIVSSVTQARFNMNNLLHELVDVGKFPVFMTTRPEYPKVELDTDCRAVSCTTLFIINDLTPDIKLTVVIDILHKANSYVNVSLVYDEKIVKINNELQILTSKVSKRAVQANIRTLLKNAKTIIK